MNKTLSNESYPIASAYQSLTANTQYRHSENMHKSLITLDCVISELKRIQAAHKAAGNPQKAAGLNRAIAVFRGMA